MWAFLLFFLLLLLSFQHFLDRGDDIFRTESVLLQQLSWCSTFAKRIIHSNHFLGSWVKSGQHLSYAISKAAIDLMFLTCHDTTGLFHGRQNSFDVKRFD